MMKTGFSNFWRAAVAVTLLLSGASAGAASLQVGPTSVTLQARQNADGLTLSNTGTTPLHAQVRVFRWTQQDGEDKLEPTKDIAVSPPMLVVAPGAQQLVRVIRLQPPPADTETSYRVIVDELPVAVANGAAIEAKVEDAKPGLQFVLQYSVPVFLMPQGEAAIAPVLQSRLVQQGQDNFIEIGNSGKLHAQIADLTFVDAKGERHKMAPGLSGYVLPGQTKRWPLPATSPVPATGTFKARINGEPVEQSLPLGPAVP